MGHTKENKNEITVYDLGSRRSIKDVIDVVMKHLEGYDDSAASGMPAEALLALLRYNLKGFREWTPEQFMDALRQTRKR